MRKRISITFAILFVNLFAMARHSLSGTVIDSTDSKGIAGCDIILLRGDSIFSETKTASDGKFEIREIPGGEYTVEASALGYGLERRGIAVNGEQHLDIALEPLKSTALDEVTVTADKSDIVTRTANGQIFYLSKEARALGNPFMALMEIPLLISDPNAASISTVYGDSPLVLVNGNRVNSGISPIKPSEIESVEIVTNPSARYIREGYKSVVNIRLKPKSGPFTWIELATRHDLPVDYGFGTFQFEVGNPALSVYGRLSGEYKYREKTFKDICRQSASYTQAFTEDKRSDAHKVLGELLLKGNPSKHDYYAIYAYIDSSLKEQKYDGEGSVTQSSEKDYAYSGQSRTRNTVATASAYYKHSFALGHHLESRLYYNYNRNRLAHDRLDSYAGVDETEYGQLFRNRRHSGTLQIDYTLSYGSMAEIIAGASTMFNNDRIGHVSDPRSLFRHRNVTEYLYAGWSDRLWNKVWAVLSAGVEMVWIDAAGYSNNYVRPHSNLGFNWMINRHNSLDITYQLTNTSPSVTQLNPYNTSTDNMYVVKGNPHLKPQWMHYLPFTYTFNTRGLYIWARVYYKEIRDLLSPTGYTDGNGVFVSTYANVGRLRQKLAGLNASYRFSNGRVYASFSVAENCFDNRKAHAFREYSAGGNWRTGPWSFYGRFFYQTRAVDDITITDYHTPGQFELQANYNFSPDFWMGVCLKNPTGKYRFTERTQTDSYRQVSDITLNYRRPSVWFIIRYAFRRNQDKRIKLDKVLNSTETGIRL